SPPALRLRRQGARTTRRAPFPPRLPRRRDKETPRAALRCSSTKGSCCCPKRSAQRFDALAVDAEVTVAQARRGAHMDHALRRIDDKLDVVDEAHQRRLERRIDIAI